MRVVAGTARGRRLAAPDGREVRPTSDRVRESVFNALGSLGAVDGARVLDLFAGSGALAIEALSRGAEHAVLVERDRQARRTVLANLVATGLGDRAEVVAGDALGYLARCDRRFDLALLDPPYRFDAWPALLDALGPVLADEAVVVIESDRVVAVPDDWHVERGRRYGGTFVGISRLPPTPGPPGTDHTEPC